MSLHYSPPGSIVPNRHRGDEAGQQGRFIQPQTKALLDIQERSPSSLLSPEQKLQGCQNKIPVFCLAEDRRKVVEVELSEVAFFLALILERKPSLCRM